MRGKFAIANEIEPKIDDFGASTWLSNPPNTGSKHLTVIDVKLDPGKGHDFHKHPDQEEVVLVIAGMVEQWVDREKRILGPGDSAFIPPDVVHASFNVGDHPQRLSRSSDLASGPSGTRWSMSRTTRHGRHCVERLAKGLRRSNGARCG